MLRKAYRNAFTGKVTSGAVNGPGAAGGDGGSGGTRFPQQRELLAFESERKLLKTVGLFDVYQGDKLEKGKKSYALSFILQDSSKTLTDEQVEKAMARIAGSFNEKLGAVIRQ